MDTIQFLLLPTVVQAIIIHFMDINTILILSTLSDKIRKIIKDANVKLQSITIQLADQKTVISMNRKANNYHIYFFDEWKNNSTDRAVDFTDFSGRTSNSIASSGQQTQMLEYILDLFKVEKINVYIKEENLQSSYLWHLKQSFHLLNVKQVCPSLTYEDVTFLLNNLESDVLIIEGTVQSDQLYTHGLTNKTVSLRNPTWLHFDAILNSTSSSIKFHSCKDRPTSQNINCMLKKWLIGGLPNLRNFQVFMSQVPYSEDGFNLGSYQAESYADLKVNSVSEHGNLVEFEGQNLNNGKQITLPDGGTATVFLEEKIILIHVRDASNN